MKGDADQTVKSLLQARVLTLSTKEANARINAVPWTK
jgi:hypothetical protein